MDFLIHNEIIHQAREDDEYIFSLTKLGEGILEANQSPEEGLLVYLDLQNANKQMVLSNELHMLYLLSPISLTFKVNWNNFHRFYKNLLPIEVKICDLIGIEEEKIVRYGHELQCR